MNYIKELNAFYDWLEINSLSTSGIVLWHALMHINNKAGWAKEFTVATSVLCIKTGLAERTISKARNELKQKGRIDWKSRKGNQSAIYTMMTLSAHGADNRTEKDIENELSAYSADSSADNRADKYADSSADNRATLNKLNETKLNICSSTTTDQEEIFDSEFSELAKLYQQCIGQPNALTAEWIEKLLKEFGFEWFKNALLIAEKQGKRTKRYVEGILQNWKRGSGMKLESDASVVNIANRPKPTRFHTAEQRTAKYTAEGLEEIARKRREGS